MKLIAADIVLLITGTILLGGAGAGLVATGGLSSVTSTGGSTGLFNVTYSAASGQLEKQDVTNFATGSKEFNVAATNVTKLTFRVECTVQQSQIGYTVSVTITGPNNANKQDTVTCGTPKDIVVDVAPVPSGGSVAGDTEAQAKKNLGQDANATRAVGKWSVAYTGQRSGGVPPVIGGQLPPATGSITLSATQWKPNLTPSSK